MAGRAGGDPAGARDGGRTPANLAAPGLTTKRWILAAAVLGSGIVFLDSTVVNVALPRIGRDLPRTFLGVLEGQSYVYNAYLLTLSALLVLAGALTDYFGRRRMFACACARSGVAPYIGHCSSGR